VNIEIPFRTRYFAPTRACVSVRNPVWPSLQLEARKLALMSLFLDLAQNFCLILQASERCRNQQPSCMRPSLGCSGYFFVNQFLCPPRVWLFVTALVGGVECVVAAMVRSDTGSSKRQYIFSILPLASSLRIPPLCY
jgi:hypothetical protein